MCEGVCIFVHVLGSVGVGDGWVLNVIKIPFFYLNEVGIRLN